MSKGKKIKRLREKQGFTQSELAEMIRTTKQTIYKYENDIVTNIPSDRLELLANALRTTPAYLMGWEDEIKEEPSGYYTNSETKEMVQFLAENKEYQILFDAAKDLRPEDIEIATNILDRLKKGE